MYSIGENLNVINKGIGRAFKEMDPEPIREMAEKSGGGRGGFHRYQSRTGP